MYLEKPGDSGCYDKLRLLCIDRPFYLRDKLVEAYNKENNGLFTTLSLRPILTRCMLS